MSIDELDLLRGHRYAVLGHSGSGKTTLLNLMALLDRPDSDSRELVLSCRTPEQDEVVVGYHGERWVGAETLEDQNTVRRHCFGFVFQAGHLVSGLSALDNVALAMALDGVDFGQIRERAKRLLDSIGVPQSRLRARPRDLSGGEYQRIAVARALAHEPQVLFADEPAGNLDPVTGRRVLETLVDWQEGAPDRTLVLVTHNVEHALVYCDSAIVVSGGRIRLAGPTSRLAGRRELEEHLDSSVAALAAREGSDALHVG